MDYLFLGSRWPFVAGYIREIIKARRLAVSGKYDRDAWVQSSWNILKLAERCGGRFEIRGLENIRHLKGPVVFVSNHMSTLETFVFPCIIAPHMEVTFVVKSGLVRQFLFGPVMRSRNPIVVERKNPREDLMVVLKQGRELLKNGTSLIIFPQSTRSVVFDRSQFNSMGVKLALSAGVPVVPVAIKTDFWENGKFLKDVGPVSRSKTIHFSFHPPMAVHGTGKEEHQFIVEFISSRLKEWEVVSNKW